MRSLPVRAVGVFVSPLRVFEDLREAPRAVGALLLGVGVVVLSALLLPVELYETLVREGAMASGQDLPVDDPQAMARVLWVAGVFASVVAWPLLALVASAILALLFLFGLGWEGTFRGVFAVVCHALLVVAVGGLLLVPLRIVTGDLSLALSVATFLPMLEEGGLLFRFLSLLDLFNLWAYALMGAGIAVVTGRGTSVGTGVGVALGVALLLTFFMAAAGGFLEGMVPAS